MTLCRILVDDFMHRTGRFDDKGGAGYDRNDVAFGITYAVGMLTEGLKVEPFHGFKLDAFAHWCANKLRDECNALHDYANHRGTCDRFGLRAASPLIACTCGLDEVKR